MIETSSSFSLLKKKSKDCSKSHSKSRSGSSKGLHWDNGNCSKRDHHSYLSLNNNGTTNRVVLVVVLDAEELFYRVPHRHGRMEWWYWSSSGQGRGCHYAHVLQAGVFAYKVSW